MSILNHFKHLTLTGDQEKALLKIESFLESDAHVFMLKGYAGTGKTTLLKGIPGYINENKMNCLVMAPTGRAAMNIRQKTGLKASTIHRAVYNIQDIEDNNSDEDHDSFKIIFSTKVIRETNTVILVDESSMISDKEDNQEFFRFGSGKLLSDLLDFARLKQNLGTKIIFSGDNAQLLPVNMNLSPALDSDYLRDVFSVNADSYTLKQVIRHLTGSGILNSATRIRSKIEENRFNEFQLDYSKNDIHRISPDDVLMKYNPDSPENNIIITHSNRRSLAYNKAIRQKILKYDSELSPGDILLNTRNNYNYPVDLYNGMFVRVTEVGEPEKPVSVRFYIEKGKTETVLLTFREILVEVQNENNENIRFTVKILNDFLTSPEGSLHPYKQRALYIDFKNRMAEKKIKPKTDEYKEALRSDPYFNALQVKYGYALTCHKSQGGEWENVFVDFNTFMGVLSKGFFRWAYTAITRSKNIVFEINAPNISPLNQFVIRDITPINRVQQNCFYYPRDIYEDDFQQWHIDRMTEIFEKQNIKFETDRNISYQLRYFFERNGERCTVSLYYNNHFFIGKTDVLDSNNDDFKNLVRYLLDEAFYIEKLPFTKKFAFQKQLHIYFTDLCRENNIPILNIHQEEWSDKYFLKTDARCAGIEFFYNKNHIYTNAVPFSMQGNDDQKLKFLVDKLKGE